MKTRFFALTYSNHDWSVCHLRRKLNDDRVPARSRLRLKYYLGGLASAFTDKILEGWNERLVSRLCVQNIPSFTAKLMNGSAFPRKKHTEFHVPCQECIFGHGVHNFARDAAFFPAHLVTINNSSSHQHGVSPVIPCLFYSLLGLQCSNVWTV